MSLAYIENGSLLERYLTSIYYTSENTKKAYLTDLCVFFRELFTEFWEFDQKYNFLAQKILIKYLENQNSQEVNQKDSEKPAKISRSLSLLTSYRRHFPNPPVFSFSRHRLSMNLNPQPFKTLDSLVAIRPEDYRLINIVFSQHQDSLQKDFFQDIYRPEKLAQVLEHLKACHRNQNNSLARKYSALKSFESFLVKAGLLEERVMYCFPRPGEIRNSQPYLSEKEMLHFLESIPLNSPKNRFGARDRAMFELLYGTGIRINELLNIELNNLNLREKTLFLRRTKGGNSREVSLPKGIIAYLKDYEKHRPLLYAETPDKCKYFFLNCRSQKIDPVVFLSSLTNTSGRRESPKKSALIPSGEVLLSIWKRERLPSAKFSSFSATSTFPPPKFI